MMKLPRLIASDIRRYSTKWECFGSVSFWVIFLYRLSHRIIKSRRPFKILYIIIFSPVLIIFKFAKLITGIQIPCSTEIGEGFKIFHYGNIVIAASAKIGKNVSLHPEVTIGRIFNGSKSGCPTIGDNTVIFSGSRVLGNIELGSHVVVGANSVVISNVPSYSVVAGIPGKVLSDNSRHCFNDYWKKIFKQDE